MSGKGQGSKAGGKSSGNAPRPANRPAARPSVVSSTLYERYKDALRRGHVAALRGRNDAAMEAYREAASIAPDRALPHASIGGILAKLNRPADAIASYEHALSLAPRDEAALRGLAETQTRLGRRPAAAATLDRLASALEAGSRTADATDAARRALELEETPARRTRVEALAERLRTASPGDEAAGRALSQALKVLEPSEAVSAVAAAGVVEVVAAPEPEPASEAAAPEPEQSEPEPEERVLEEPAIEEILPAEGDLDEVPAEVVIAAVVPTSEAAAEDVPAEELATSEAELAEPEPEAAEVAAAEPELEPETAEVPPVPEPEPEIHEPIGLGIALGAAAEAQLYAGELADAHSGLMAAARAHRRADRLVAAIDACYLAIGIAPSDPELHLLLAEIYLDRGWRSQATEKLMLLSRLADLDDDPVTRERLCAVVSSRLPDEPRLAALCA